MGVKDIATSFGILPTFMAKVSQNLPGSGGHMHVNLANEEGKNLFYDEKDSDSMSDLFKHFLAGQLYLLPQMMPMLAPTVNSYKRLVAGYWAPTKPTWAVENRTSSYRVIPGGKSTRLEVR
jgi:glutamine synthetase